MGKARLFSQLIAGNGTIKATKLGEDIPITEQVATASALPSSASVGEQAFVQDTNRLYIWNGTGWYNIALINTSPTWDSGGQPLSTYLLSTDNPQVATTVTLSASDPEGIPIQYSHITGGQMDSIATISQDSSVFTITPKTSTQAPDGGVGTITFRASDGVNILPYVSSFTLSFVENHFFVDHRNHGASANNPLAVGLDSTGQNLYMKPYANDQYIYKWTLGTAYELGTIPSTYTQRYSDSTISTNRAFYVKPDGSKIFHFDSIDLTEISMTTTNDLSTASKSTYTNTAQGNQIRGGHPNQVTAITFSHNGSKFYHARSNGFTSTYNIHEHNLTTPWDITTLQDPHTSFVHGFGSVYGMFWSNNGLKFWANNSTTIKEWTTTVAYSITNFGSPTTYTFSNLITGAVDQASGTGKTFSSYSFNSIWLSSNGKIMYICVDNAGGGPGILKLTLTTANTLADGFVF